MEGVIRRRAIVAWAQDLAVGGLRAAGLVAVMVGAGVAIHAALRTEPDPRRPWCHYCHNDHGIVLPQRRRLWRNLWR